MIFGNIKNKIFLTVVTLSVFGFLGFVNFTSADQIGTLELEIPQNFIGTNKATIKATYFSTDSSTRTVTLDLKKYSGTTGEVLVETRTFSINTGNLNAQELEFINLEQDPVGYVFFAYFGNTFETKYPASGLFKIPNTQSPPLAVNVAIKTTSSAKIDVSSIPNTENSVTMTLFKSEAGGLTLTQIGQPVNENNVNGQASHIFQGLTSGTNYRVKAQTASAYGEVDFKTEGNPPAELPVGGTSATIGGWCVENTATGTTSLCASTARWGSKEECETINGAGKCTEVYTLLAPLPFVGSEIETGGGPEGLAKYLIILFRLAIGIIGVLAVLMIVFAGMEYMTAESPFGKGEGKNRLTGAIIGLLLALASVIILQTIDPTLLNLALDIRSVRLESDVPQIGINGKFCTKTFPGGLNKGDIWASVAGATTVELPGGVIVNKAECEKVGDICTSIIGLDLAYINTVITKCPDCKPLQITGGTECWLHGGKTHNTSHGPNRKTVDLHITDALTAYIIGNQTLTDWKRYERDGISFLKEPDHWHAGP